MEPVGGIKQLIGRAAEGGVSIRLGRVERIDTSGPVTAFTIAGRAMPMLDTGGTVAVGDVVLWIGGDTPAALGPVRAS